MTPRSDNNQPQPPRRVFDVSHPRYTRPPSTSRPLIVGHHPQAADPMVNQRPITPKTPSPPQHSEPPEPAKVEVQTQASEPTMPPVVEPHWEVHKANMPLQPEPTISEESATAELTEATPAPVAHHSLHHHAVHQEPTPEVPMSDETPPAAPTHHEHESFLFNWWMLGIFIIVAIFVTLYLLVDAGVIRGASHLPFHIFQQKQ